MAQSAAGREMNQGTPLNPRDRVRSAFAGRTGSVVKVYPDGSAAIHWDDGEPQAAGLAHERMPRSLLETIQSNSCMKKRISID